MTVLSEKPREITGPKSLQTNDRAPLLDGLRGAGRLHAELAVKNNLLHVIVVPSGCESFVFDATLCGLLLLQQA